MKRMNGQDGVLQRARCYSFFFFFLIQFYKQLTRNAMAMVKETEASWG